MGELQQPHIAALDSGLARPNIFRLAIINQVGSIKLVLKVVHSQSDNYKSREITYRVKTEVHNEAARVTVRLTPGSLIHRIGRS